MSSRARERRCEFMVNTDVSITLHLADIMGLAHPLLGWFRRHAGRVCYSELLRDELRDMERRGKLCPGDAGRILNTLRRYGAWEEPARVGWAKREALRLIYDEELPDRMLNDVKLALHAATLRARVVSYNERDYQRLTGHIRGLIHIRPPGEPLAYTCSQGGQASKGVQGRGWEGGRRASKASEEVRRPKGEGHRGASRRPIQGKAGRGKEKANRAGKKKGRKVRRRKSLLDGLLDILG